MEVVHINRKPISMIVMVAFTTLLILWADPAPAASSPPASGNKTATSLEKGGSEGTGFLEQEESKPVVKKQKKILWDLVGIGVIVGAVIVAAILMMHSSTFLMRQ